MRVQSAAARYTVEESDSVLRITIHPQGLTWRVVLFSLVACFLVLWFGLLLLGLITQATTPLYFIVVAFLLGLVGVLSAVYVIAWDMAGRERITVTADVLEHGRSIGSLVRSGRYRLAGVTRLRIPLENGMWLEEIIANRRHWPRGLIQFDYHGRTKCLGIGLLVPEAQAILAVLEARVARR